MTATVKTFKRAVPMLIAAAIVAVGFSACNTVEGAGQDLQSGGKAIENTADDAKN